MSKSQNKILGILILFIISLISGIIFSFAFYVGSTVAKNNFYHGWLQSVLKIVVLGPIALLFFYGSMSIDDESGKISLKNK